MRSPDRRAGLIVRAGGRTCALPVGQVVETMRPLPIEPIPGAPSFVRGVAIIRGEAVPVVDLGLLVGALPGAAGRFVTLRAGARSVAVAVEAVLGVRDLDAAALAAAPPLLREASAESIEAMGTLDAELLLLLRPARLLADDIARATPDPIPP